MKWHRRVWFLWSSLLLIVWLSFGETAHAVDSVVVTIICNDSVEEAPLVEPLDSVFASKQDQKVNVSKTSKTKSVKKSAVTVKKIAINSATQKELESLPGIGKVLGQRIIASRDVEGVFTSVDDLQRVKGIGVKTVAKLSPLIVIE